MNIPKRRQSLREWKKRVRLPLRAEVLPEIRKAIGQKTKIFVDGGVRSGGDVFKMLANVMGMAGCRTLRDIDFSKIRVL